MKRINKREKLAEHVDTYRHFQNEDRDPRVYFLNETRDQRYKRQLEY